MVGRVEGLREVPLTNIYEPYVPPPQQYYDQQTIELADRLLPVELEGKNKLEIALYLDNFLKLVDILKQFANQTYIAQIYRNRGLTYCCFQVLWESVGDVRNIDPRNMWNLNYLLFTAPNAINTSNFIFAVLYCINQNLRNYLRQTLTAQGLSYCCYSGNSISGLT